jgi:lipid II:glycine glycyltransferase (peptidoglycan interpeptide bridge formation enzyme)
MLVKQSSPDRAAPRASLLQTEFWGEFKSGFGWRPLSLSAEGERGSFELLALVRGLRGGLSFAYVPLGPEIEVDEASRGAFLAELSEGMRPLLPRSCLFIRFDPPWSLYEPAGGASADPAADEVAAPVPGSAAEILRPGVGAPLKRAVSDVQTPDTVVVDLRPSEEAMLAAMKPKWRYNIRLAEKKGVRVEEAGSDRVPEFYRLYRETAARDRIAIHPEAYYRRFMDLARRRREGGDPLAPDARLWIARHEGAAIAAILTVFAGREAVYLYGASSDEKRNLMPAYALQWTAMLAAKGAGCESYDLFGIPPRDDPEHPMAGLYRFKTGFGGRILRRAGSWDYPLRPLAYAAFRGAEKLRRWWHKDLSKRLRRRPAA